MVTRVLLVDGLNLVRRIFEARGARADEEFVYSCQQSLQRCLRDLLPTHAVVVWDSTESTWRHRLDPSYKANRPATPTLLVDAVPQLQAAFQSLHVASLVVENYEADDVIATMAVTLDRAKSQAVIVSTDKMFYPLMSNGISVYHQFDRTSISPASVREKYGLDISQLVDYWALSGDNSNNIKGVPGIGKKTATLLLQEHGSVDNMLMQKSVKKVVEHEAEVILCKQLVELKTDVELGVNLKDYRLNNSI